MQPNTAEWGLRRGQGQSNHGNKMGKKMKRDGLIKSN